MALILAAAEQGKLWHYLLTPAFMAFVVAIVAVMGATMYALANCTYRHRERMAKIERGIDPDRKSDLQV